MDQTRLIDTLATRGRDAKMAEALRSKTDWLFRPVDAASAGTFRVMFGVLMLVEVYRYFLNGWVHGYYIAPTFHFKYLFFEWLHPWPGIGMYIHFAALGVLAALIALGLFYRAATALFFIGFSYVFLLDQARYLNHFYLICLVAFLMCFVDAHRWVSFDRWLSRTTEPPTIPFWQLFVLRGQLFIVYFYAGIAKLNADWLVRGEPLRTWLFGPADGPGAELLPQLGWIVYVIGWSALLFDLSIGFLLLWRRTRALAMVLAFLFHLGNSYVFQIGIFPYLGFGMTLLFLDPDWPRALLGGPKPRPASRRRAASALRPARPRWVFPFVTAYLAAQTLIPLRHWLYPGDVAWTDEGHRLSWRMKLRTKESRIEVKVFDPATGREWLVEPKAHLDERQARYMEVWPDMAVQFAHYLRDHYRNTEGVERPEVYMRLLCSLNGRPEQDLIRPGINLAEMSRTLWPADWIMPAPPVAAGTPAARPGVLPAAAR